MAIISCADAAKTILDEVDKSIKHWEADGWEYPPKLAIIINSAVEEGIPPYIKGLLKDAKGVICETSVHMVPSSYEAKKLIEVLNKEETVHGILLYKSDSGSWDYQELANYIFVEKDVDGASLTQKGLLSLRPNDNYSRYMRIPATARACAYWVWKNIPQVTGNPASIAIIGRGDVGMATSLALINRGYSPTVYNSSSCPDINDVVSAFDVVINTAPKKFWCNIFNRYNPTFIIDISGSMGGNIFESKAITYCKDIGKLTRAMMLDNVATSWCQLSIPDVRYDGTKVTFYGK